uniref:Protein FAM32A n=1 Tax=Romanomermis culicivorax TaxID=13658 RepID=A0A915HSB5_ROMCU
MNDVAVRGKLRLKKDAGVTKMKKKLKSHDPSLPCTRGISSNKVDDKNREGSIDAAAQLAEGPIIRKTAAELAFERRQRQLLTERVMKKAQSSHREKVENFNRYLDNLVEINDIPKVSWTK